MTYSTSKRRTHRIQSIALVAVSMLAVGCLQPPEHQKGHLTPTIERLEAGLSATVVIQGDFSLTELLGLGASTRSVRMKNMPITTVELTSREQLDALLGLVPSEAVMSDRPMRAHLAETLTMIGQPAAVDAGFRGQGQTVVVLDTGVDYTRNAFGSCTGPGEPAHCRVVEAFDVAPDDGDLDSASHHGTNVAAIVAGAAPGSSLIVLDVFDGDTAWSSTIISALDWVISNRAEYNIASVNLSLGGGDFDAPCTFEPLSFAMQALVEHDIVPVAAAGNDALVGAMGSPACAPAAISVGAVHTNAFAGVTWQTCSESDVSPGDPACFSNVASFLDVVAPGVAVTAGDLTMSGTSMAAPHVAAAAAIFRSLDPNSTVADIRTFITSGPAVLDARVGASFPLLDLSGLASEPEPEPEPEPEVEPSPAPEPEPEPEIEPEPAPAPVGSILINQGHSFTSRPDVTVTVTVDPSVPASRICLSNDGICDRWTELSSTTISWSLVAGSGHKTVTAWLESPSGVVSVPMTSSILLDTTAPEPGEVAVNLTDSGEAVVSFSGFSDAHSGLQRYLVFTGQAVQGVGCPAVGGFILPPTPNGSLLLDADAASQGAKVCAVDRAGHTVTVSAPLSQQL